MGNGRRITIEYLPHRIYLGWGGVCWSGWRARSNLQWTIIGAGNYIAGVLEQGYGIRGNSGGEREITLYRNSLTAFIYETKRMRDSTSFFVIEKVVEPIV